MEKRILRSFLLISYHIRTGLAVTALCKSCSQTLEPAHKDLYSAFHPPHCYFLQTHCPACFQCNIFYFWPLSCPYFGFIFKKPFLADNINGLSLFLICLSIVNGIVLISNVINKFNMLGYWIRWDEYFRHFPNGGALQCGSVQVKFTTEGFLTKDQT